MTEGRHKRPCTGWLHVYNMSKRGTSIGTERRLAAKDLRVGREQEVMVNGNRISFWGDENVLEWQWLTMAQICKYIKWHWIVYFERWNFFFFGKWIISQLKKKFIPPYIQSSFSLLSTSWSNVYLGQDSRIILTCAPLIQDIPQAFLSTSQHSLSFTTLQSADQGPLFPGHVPSWVD